MNNIIANIYWRTIKRGARAFNKVPLNIQSDIRILAAKDVESNAITPHEYQELIGEPYLEV